MRKTKIVCTLGPASADEKVMEAMLRAGMNVARFNFSHGTHESHREMMQRFRAVRDRLGVAAAVMLDTKGPEIRLKDMAGGEAMLARLREIDPEAAARLHPADEKRVIRALEVYEETGKTITQHDAETRAVPPRYDAAKIALDFADRQDLYDRIDRRVDAMMQQGLLDEVGAPNAFVQYDIYHAQRTEGELAATLAQHLARIGHIQIADNPGRHEPGSGEINYRFLFQHLDRIGYQGWVGAEYRPASTTEAGLGWRAALRR